MRVWLVGFVLLFVGVELFEWVAQLEFSQAGGYWIVLGGLGLAAISNAKYLPRLSGDQQTESTQRPKAPLVSQEPSTSQESSVGEAPEKGIDRSEDSISFRVRSPWR